MRATFPHQLLRQEVVPRMVGMSLDTQQSISGAETVTPTMAGHWEAMCSFVIHGEAAQLAWQAFQAQMEGRVGTTLVPMRTRYRPRDRDGHPVYGCGPASLAGAQTWEHFGFDSAPVATMALVSHAPLRATVLSVAPGNTTGLRPGQFFTLGERLHQVQHHWIGADGVTRLMIRPGLRQAHGIGDMLILDRPVCLMRLVSETEGEFDHLLDRLPRVTATFVEAT